MKSEFDLTIAISSYNRDGKVGETLTQLFASDMEGVRRIELLVVDDGSPRPVRDVINGIGIVPTVFQLRLIEQENSGIGATRNRGYREAQSDLILFLDDDILVRIDTIKSMLKARIESDAAVMFGHYPFASHSSESLRGFAALLYGYDRLSKSPRYERVDAITSGLLLVDKTKLPDKGNFYRSDLTIPAAEEHEVIFRFSRLGIPILSAEHIFASHNHHLELKWLVQQQYKYGLATAEAFAKVPEIVGIEKFAELKAALDPATGGVKNTVKRIFASGMGRKIMLAVARLFEKVFPNGNHNRLFGLTTAAYFRGGYEDGRLRFRTDFE